MIPLIGRLLVGGVLLYAGFIKALGPSAEFAAAIEAYKILPAGVAWLLAQGLPYLEMGLGLYLICGFQTRRSALTAAALFGVFILALSSSFLRGIDIGSCGCFGVGSTSPKTTLVLDTVLFITSLLTFRLSKTPGAYSLDRTLQ